MAAEIPLDSVDRVEILTLVDNVLDLLLVSTDVAKRMGPTGIEGRAMPVVEAPLLESGRAADTPVAEHGLAFLVYLESRGGLLFFSPNNTK